MFRMFMKMSNLNLTMLDYVAERDAYFLKLERGPRAGRLFYGSLQMCDNPVCGCERVTWIFSPIEEMEPALRGGSKISWLEFDLDLGGRTFHLRDAQTLQEESAELARSVVEEMAPEDWRELEMLFRNAKAKRIFETDPETWNFDFPEEVLRGEETMAAFVEVFPHAPVFSFQFEGDAWWADDQHCVLEECPCEKVAIAFLRTDPPRLFGRRAPIGWYDLNSGTIKALVPSRKPERPLPALMEALKRAHPELDAQLQQRRRILKRLYTRTYGTGVKSEPPAPARRVKVGRNDPCPCGSGKKYKHCCIAAEKGSQTG
jgi:hypothetical protein